MKRISLLVCLVFFLTVAFLVVPVGAYTITMNTGNSQSAPVGTVVATPPSVVIRYDENQTPVSTGVLVTFTITSGGGTITGATQTTNENGVATVGSWTLGTTAGSNTLDATADTVTGVTFTATGTAGTATQIAANSATSQSAPVGTAVTTLPSVIVKDAYNNPKSGEGVTFVVFSGGGSATGLSATTGSNGVATVGSWTLGTTAGSNTMTATSGSLVGSPVTFTATGTSSASTPTITSVTPASASNSGSQTIDVVGTGFISGATVTLTQTGQSTVTGVAVGTDTATTLSRNFNLNGIASGTWTLVILNSDGGTITRSFTVNSATSSTVTSISPTSGTVNTTVSTTITGTGFVASSAKIRLYKNGNYIGGSVNSGGSTTQLTGTFNLYQATPGSYSVCVLPDGTEASKTCSPTFTVYSVGSTANGTINIKSNPSISKVFLNSVYQGYTPLTLDNITPNTYTVMIRSAGYNDYSESVAVTAGNISYVTASLVLAPDVTTVTTTAPKTTISTVKTTKKSTLKTPTPWPTATPTPASSVGILAILGAVGAGLIVLRKK